MDTSRRRFVGGIATTALTALAGCEGRGQSQPDALAWKSHPIGETYDLAVTEESVYVPGDTLYALRPDKTERWSYEPPAPAVRLFRSDDLILELSGQPAVAFPDRLHAVNRNGTPEWTTEAPRDRFLSVEAVDETSVYVSTYAESDGEERIVAESLVALDADTGSERWRLDGLDADDVSLDSDTLYITTGRTVRALDATDGSDRWERRLSEGETDLATLRGVDERHLYVQDTETDGLLALDRADGTVQWSYSGRFFVVDARVDRGRVYVLRRLPYRPDVVVALDASTGGIEWRVRPSDRDAGLQLGPLRSGTLYLGGPSVSTVDIEAGRTRWQWTPEDDDACTVTAVCDGTVLVRLDDRLCGVVNGARRWSYEGHDPSRDDLFFFGGVASHGAYYRTENTVYRFRP